MSKKDLQMMEMFNKISEVGLTPNQFYLLLCISENITSQNINLHQELRSLISDDWINENDKIKSLTPKAVSILAKVDGYFKVHKKKTSIQLLGKEHVDNLTLYVEMFPKMKGGSGSYLRSNIKDLETNFRWFFENYSYEWPIIIEATRRYVNEHLQNDFKYIRTSKYFIRKQDSSKLVTSDLADMCERVLGGEDEEVIVTFTEKVV